METSNFAVRGNGSRREGPPVENMWDDMVLQQCQAAQSGHTQGKASPEQAGHLPGIICSCALLAGLIVMWGLCFLSLIRHTHSGAEGLFMCHTGWVQWNLLVLLVPVTVGLKCHGKELLANEASRMPACLCGHAENPPPCWMEKSWTITARQDSCFLEVCCVWGRHAAAGLGQPCHLSQLVETFSKLFRGTALTRQESSRGHRHKQHGLVCKSHLRYRQWQKYLFLIDLYLLGQIGSLCSIMDNQCPIALGEQAAQCQQLINSTDQVPVSCQGDYQHCMTLAIPSQNAFPLIHNCI